MVALLHLFNLSGNVQATGGNVRATGSEPPRQCLMQKKGSTLEKIPFRADDADADEHVVHERDKIHQEHAALVLSLASVPTPALASAPSPNLAPAPGPDPRTGQFTGPTPKPGPKQASVPAPVLAVAPAPAPPTASAPARAPAPALASAPTAASIS